MNSNLTKQDKITLTLALVFFVGVSSLIVLYRKSPLTLSQSETKQIDYEMAKISTTESLYSLEGRQVDRNYENLPTTLDAKNKSLATTKGSKDTKNTKAATKANQKTAVASKAAPVKTAVASKTDLLKQQSNTQKSDSTPTPQQSENIQYTQSPVQNTTAPTPQESPEKQFKTVAEWIKDIATSGDRQTVLALVTALKSNELTEAQYYTVVQELLKSKDEKVKGLGLYALRAVTSYASYVLLVKSQAAQSQSYQQYIQDALLTYHQTTSLGYLKQALTSQDHVVVVKTVEILKIGLTSIQSGTTTSLMDVRYKREPSYTTFSMKSYISFIPFLMQLEQSGDPEFSANVQQVAQLIQANQTIASNP